MLVLLNYLLSMLINLDHDRPSFDVLICTGHAIMQLDGTGTLTMSIVNTLAECGQNGEDLRQTSFVTVDAMCAGSGLDND